MSRLHVRQIRKRLQELFDPVVAEALRKDEGQYLSRALAAFVICEELELTPAAAWNCVVDEKGDNGIDAVAIDADSKGVLLIQSKWSSDGSGSPDVASTIKMCQGFRDLVDGHWDRFGPSFRVHQTQLEAALDDTGTNFTLVLAHSGDAEMADKQLRVVDDLLKEINDTTEILRFEYLRQKDIYGSVSQVASSRGVDLEVMLREWGKIDDPYDAYYGTVTGEDIANWYEEYGDRLLERNLRKVLRESLVNQSLVETATNDPSSFWYFNNGITILADTLEKTPLGGSKRHQGVFRTTKASVVNGAQTVGSIAAAARRNSESVSNTVVQVRIISLADCPEGFGVAITRATNTQNRVERRDFASLDPIQERLAIELRLEYDKQYAVKSGEREPLKDEGCSIVDASVALACLNRDSDLAVQAKREVGLLWSDTQRRPYTALFNDSVTAIQMWRAVEAVRCIESELGLIRAGLEGRHRQITVHGNRLISHIVLRSLETSRISDANYDWTIQRDRVPEVTGRVVELLSEAVELDWQSSYIASLFKNATKCRGLATKVVRLMRGGPPTGGESQTRLNE